MRKVGENYKEKGIAKRERKREEKREERMAKGR